ncbi:MAG: SsrA-binding protein SmpB [Lactobacillaceae bacterium]|jgi:SsrA-binding protein|nr:SsrA-binding protein SmpB [Lactobacillaceae bacterium]
MAKKKVLDDNLLANNRKAGFNYAIGETFEAGIKLTGTEIKSVRMGQINISEGYVVIRNGEAWLDNVNISEYKQGNQFNVDPNRRRKLLLHKREIGTLQEADEQKGKAIVPLKVYLKHGFAKVLIGIGTGKKLYDKRETIKQRDQEREINRVLKNY